MIGYLFGEASPRMMPCHLFSGVRSRSYGTAVCAEISKQNYTVCPRYWYFDVSIMCRDCGDEFVFSADEQRFWYEEREFYVDSLPVRCFECRKSRRLVAEFQREYDENVALALKNLSGTKFDLRSFKTRVLDAIEGLVAAEVELPERMKRNRTTLRAQLAKLD